ncbi:MAG: Trp biosynthesis-associated membrane protein [Pseudonocardiaceae bacterium]
MTAVSRRALLVTVVLLIGAAAALGGSAALGWARAGFQVPLRGTVTVQMDGTDLAPALGPLALLALAAVAAVLATGGWARRLFGALLLLVAVPPAIGVIRVADEGRLVGIAVSVGQLPARSVPDGTVTVLPAGPALAGLGAGLLAAAGVALVLRGHRMPRMGRRYRAPTAPPAIPEDQGLWERIDAGEDPTAPGDPR